MGTMELNFTPRKKVTLINILHVPGMNMNLVSGDILEKPGMKSVYESGKSIIMVYLWKRVIPLREWLSFVLLTTLLIKFLILLI